MASTAAQDEYDALFADKETSHTHPEDAAAAASVAQPDTSSPTSSRSTSPDPATAAAAARYSSIRSSTLSAPPPAASKSRTYLPAAKSYSNTGPKGVIADAQAYLDAQRAQQRNSGIAAHRVSNSDAIAALQPYVEGLAFGEREEIEAAALKTLRGREDEDEDEDEAELLDSEGEGDDDEFMEQWRRERMAEIRGARVGGGGGAEKIGAPRTYGGLGTVDADGYLEAVDGSGRDTVVVVFIYDDMSEVSALVESCLRDLARKHRATRFIKLHFEEAEMEVAGVPAVLAYRGGDKFAGLVPLVDEIPDDADLSAESLEALFQRHQIL